MALCHSFPIQHSLGTGKMETQQVMTSIQAVFFSPYIGDWTDRYHSSMSLKKIHQRESIHADPVQSMDWWRQLGKSSGFDGQTELHYSRKSML